MNRWLLNTFPTWLLALMIVGTFVAIAWAVQTVVRRRFPSVAEGEHNDLAGIFLGVLIGVYGIVLAFVIVALYEDFNEAEAVVRQEATELAQLYRASDAFPPDVRDDVRGEIKRYVRVVVDEEWKAMEHGRDEPHAWASVARLYAIHQRYEPEGTAAETYYAQSVSHLDELVASRRDRVDHAAQSMPNAFEVLIIGGAVLLVVFLSFFGSRNVGVQTAMVVAVATLVSFNLVIAIVLDHPFSGDITISNDPYREGALAALFEGDG